jgi:hypothetical protein
MALLGCTESEMAEVIGIDEATLNGWKSEHPHFGRELARGKTEADADVAHGLYQRAIGYSHSAEKIFQHEGKIIRARFTEHYPPEPGASKIWLTNRRRGQAKGSLPWQDRIEHAGDPTQPVVFQVIRSGTKRGAG